MSLTSSEIKSFLNVVRGSQKSDEATVTGRVTRVDAGITAWVMIGNNQSPTPCSMDMKCTVGDTVTVRISGHKAVVIGNETAPATDDKRANVAYNYAGTANTNAGVAQQTAEVAQSTASQARNVASNAATKADVAEIAAQEAERVANAVNQHFWDDERGAHVTEEKKNDYLDEPNGFQQLMNSLGTILTRAVNGIEYILRSDTASGMVVYDGECAPDATDLADHAVAAFTGDGAQIGKSSDAHIEMDFNSFKLTDKDSVDFFVADDLRGSDGLAVLVETFSGNGTTMNFLVMLNPDSYVSVTDSSHEGASYTTSGRIVHFSVAPSDGATVTVTYKTASTSAKVYTLGNRMVGSVAGPMSLAEGIDTTSSGYASHAEGSTTTASGTDSHAEGIGTIASDYASHAEGAYTIASDYASHVEGIGGTASGYASHAESDTTTASGRASHAEGDHTVARSAYQHVEGKYNVADANDTYAHIIGNGQDDTNRSNAHTVDWSGNAWYQGDVSCGGTSGAAPAHTLSSKVTVEDVYPIGSIYMNVSSTDPSMLFPGTTWRALAPGRVLIGAGTTTDSRGESKTFSNGASGGEFSHLLSGQESGVKGHTHKLYECRTSAEASGYGLTATSGFSDRVLVDTSVDTRKRATETSGDVAATNAHNNIQPYLVVHMWERTA